MQFGKLGKILAAGSVGMLLAGSTVFAALDSYPAPFVSGSSFDSLVVVGAAAAPSDVVGAIDLATRLGGETTTLVSVTGASGTISISGEGRKVASGTTQVLLADMLGKSGLRTTMTKDDLPTVLADATFTDSNEGTTQKYTQYIKLTPNGTADLTNQLEFNLPGSSSSADPDYNFGRFSTSPSTQYFYSTQVIFDKGLNSTTAVNGAEKITLFGNEYTITSGTDFTQSTASNNKLVLSGGSESRVLKGGETITSMINGISYDVTYVASSSATVGVVEVKTGGTTDQKSITKGTTVKVNGLDVFMSDVFDISSTDPTQDSGKVVLGSNKLTLQHGSKAKTGTNDDSIDGTHVDITTSSGKLSTLTIRHGGHSSSEDFITRGGSYTDNVWKSFKVVFPDVTPGLTDAARNKLSLTPSGDNLVQSEWTDDRGNTKTINWAYKASTSATNFKLADNSGNNIIVLENQTMTKDKYFVEDAGDFTHLFRVSSMSIDGTSSSNIELTDQFSGTTLKVTFGADNQDAKVIDGQQVFIDGSGASGSELRMTWGAGNANTSVGTYLTLFPVLKEKTGAHVAFTQPTNISLNQTLATGKIQLPTCAINVLTGGDTNHFNFTASSNEDGTASAIGTVTGNSSATSASVTRFEGRLAGGSVTFACGRTTTGGLIYNFTNTGVIGQVTVKVGTTVAGNTQPAIVLVEQKDSNNDAYSVLFPVTSTSSSGNNLADAGQPTFTYGNATEVSLGSDSNKLRAVDLYGTYTERSTSGQDTVKAWIPAEQVQAQLAVVAVGSTASVGTGGTTGTVKQAVPVKTAVAKLDTEVTSADKTTKNLILVGGPVVNSLVKELATSSKTWDTATYVSEGAGTAIVQLVADAFTSGRSALVVAGHSAADTRSVTSVLQNFDAYKTQFTGKNLVVWKNNVISSSSA